MAKIAPNYDKEAMFHKIMPSSSSLAEREGALKEPAPPDSAPALGSGSRDSLLRQSGVQVKKESDTQILVNIMEYAVIEKLDMAFSRFNCCKCDKCRKDAAAVALNSLKPKYVVAEQDRLGVYIALASSSEVTNAVIKAIIQIRDSPRH